MVHGSLLSTFIHCCWEGDTLRFYFLEGTANTAITEQRQPRHALPTVLLPLQGPSSHQIFCLAPVIQGLLQIYLLQKLAEADF